MDRGRSGAVVQIRPLKRALNAWNDPFVFADSPQKTSLQLPRPKQLVPPELPAHRTCNLVGVVVKPLDSPEFLQLEPLKQAPQEQAPQEQVLQMQKQTPREPRWRS